MAELPGANIPVWGAYLKLLDRQPLSTKSATGAVLLGGSQVVAQMMLDGGISSSFKVNAIVLWGAIVSITSHWFNNFITKHGPQNVFLKVLADHVLYRIPIVFIYAVYQKILDVSRPLDALELAWRAQPTMQVTSLKLWPTSMLVNYYLVPSPLRVFFVNVVQFIWCVYQALLLRRYDKVEKKAVKQDGKADDS